MSDKQSSTLPNSEEANTQHDAAVPHSTAAGSDAPPAAQARTERPNGGGTSGLDATPSNTASNNSNPESFKLLRWGVDSLYLSYQGELSHRVAAQLQRLKELAQSDTPSESAQAQYKLGGHLFEVKDKGSRLYAFILEDNAFRIQLAKPGRKVPMAYVKVSAEYLAHVGPKKAEAALYALLCELGEIEGSANVSRIDLYCDFVSSWDMEGWDRHAWVTRARGIDSHAVECQFTGWSIGLGGAIGARLYNKLLELVASNKAWVIPLWQQVGWVVGEIPWRLEFEFKRDLLIQKGLSSFFEVMHNLNGLWSYASTEWLRLTLPNPEDQTRSRWPIHPLWGHLSSVDWETKGGPLTKRFSNSRSPNDDRLLANGMSAVLSYMAKHRIDDLNDGIEDFFASAYSHHSRLAERVGLPFDDYIAERLAVKQREYNTKLNNPKRLDEIDAEILSDNAEMYRKESDGE